MVLRARRQLHRHVFLEHHRFAGIVARQIDHAEPAAADGALDGIAIDAGTAGQFVGVLARHGGVQ